MKFNKPPVVEVWVSFDFEPNENKSKWPNEQVDEYIRSCAGEFPKMQVHKETVVDFAEVVPGTLPTIVSQRESVTGFRLWNPPQTHMLQIGDDQLSYHVLKTTEETPGYRKVCNEAQEKLKDYVSLLRPKLIRHATLHYLDIVDIPTQSRKSINLNEYFTHVTDLPESPFGLTSAVSQQFRVACPDDPGPMFLQFQQIAASEDVLRFRMEWHKQSSDVDSLDLNEVWRRMDTSHDYMRKCFNASFTKLALDLFEPDAEN